MILNASLDEPANNLQEGYGAAERSTSKVGF